MKIFRIILAPLDFIMKYFKALVFLLVVFLLFSPSKDTVTQNANVARIDLEGAILSSDHFLAQVDKIRGDKNIRGVLLVINSPGGAIAPSIEISDSIRNLAREKVVVSYAQGAMASGSYYAGMWANKIIANRGSLVGSIGVIFNGMNFEELIAKLGIKTQTIKAGIYKEAGTPTRKWSEAERGMLEDLVQKQYAMFVKDVAEARGIQAEDEKAFAQGRILTAQEALDLRLIDAVGSIDDAKVMLLSLSDIPPSDAVWLRKDKLEELMEKFLGEVSSYTVRLLKETFLYSSQW